MRSSVPNDEKPAASARRAQSTMPVRSTPATALGSPMPISMRSPAVGRLLGAAELPDGDPQHDRPQQRHDARFEKAGNAPAEPGYAGIERGARRGRDVEVREHGAAHGVDRVRERV